MRTRLVLLTAAALLAAACGGTTDKGATSSPSPSRPVSSSPSASALVPPLVASDVPFAGTLGEGWRDPLLDVYAPATAKGLPLVVMFHGDPTGKTKSSLQPLAEAVADLGAVAVVANWGVSSMPPLASTAVAALNREREEVGCAVTFAVAHAAEYGADPSRLVLLGHSAGANEVSVVAYGKPSPLPECKAPAQSWTPRGVVLWEGDLLLQSTDWDAFTTSLPALVEADTPWSLLGTGAKPPAVIAVSDSSRRTLDRCDATDPKWLTWRDPTGSFRKRLTAAGAYANGCIDMGELADLLSQTMRQHGITVKTLALTESGHEYLVASDLPRLARQTVALAGAPGQ